MIEADMGVAIYVHDSVHVKHMNDFNIAGTELVCIEIKHILKRVLLSCWYRHPGSRRKADDFLENFQTVVNVMLHCLHKVYLY